MTGMFSQEKRKKKEILFHNSICSIQLYHHGGKFPNTFGQRLFTQGQEREAVRQQGAK